MLKMFCGTAMSLTIFASAARVLACAISRGNWYGCAIMALLCSAAVIVAVQYFTDLLKLLTHRK